MAQAVSSRRLTAEDQFPSPAKLCEIYGGEFGTETFFFFHKYVLALLHECSVFMFVLIFLWSGKKGVKSRNLKSTALSEFGDD